MIALVLIALVALAAAIFWPGSGVWGRWTQARDLAARSRREDVLKHMLKCETEGLIATLDSAAGALQIRPGQAAAALQQLQALGFIRFQEGRLALQHPGRDIALHIVRAHRLWESYLAEQTGMAERRWHQEAERREHLLSPKDADALAAQLGDPTFDPHGDAIPTPGGELTAAPGQPLHAIQVNQPVLITHIEDEPNTVYAQLCALGLRAGMKAYVIEKSPQRIRFWADGAEHVLAPVLANNIAVAPLTDSCLQELTGAEYLCSLRPGQTARILGLSGACRGPERRRLLDLGFVAGTPVTVEMKSPGGDPTAYRVRGTLIALRREQAGLIRVESSLAA